MRRRAQGLLAAALAIGFGGCGLFGPDQRGARVTHFSLHSSRLGRDVRETLVSPAGGPDGRPLLVFLHGRSGSEDSSLGSEMFAALAAAGRQAPDIVFAHGDDHSYWHDRRGGAWGSYVLDELIPAAIARLHADGRRVAIGGFSMGGWGALDLARLAPGRFCAVGAHSAAMWFAAGDTAPGAFDDAADFARQDIVRAARNARRPLGSAPVWIDVGTVDPFRPADVALAGALRADGTRVALHVWPGGHGGDYSNRHWTAYMAFYSRALAACRGVPA